MIAGADQRCPGAITNLASVLRVRFGCQRLDEMRGDDLGDLLFFGPLALEIRGGRHMTQLAIAPRERSVRDTAHQVLDEHVLTAFGRTRVRLNREQVLVDEAAEDARDRRGIDAGDGGDRECAVNDFPSTAASWSNWRSDGFEAVQPRGDQCVQALGNLEGVERTRRRGIGRPPRRRARGRAACAPSRRRRAGCRRRDRGCAR